MRVRSLAFAAVSLCLAGLPARAETVDTITLAGTGSGYADVNLTESVTLPAEYTVTSSGSYAGYALQRLDGRALFGSGRIVGGVTVPAMNRPQILTNFNTRYQDVQLAPGRYRFYLLTDGTATVTIPMQGLSRSHVVNPAHATSVAAGVVDLGSVAISTHRVPIVSTGATLGLLVLDQQMTAGQSWADVCFRQGNEDCSLLATSRALPADTAQPGELAAGPWNGVFQSFGVGLMSSSTGFYLALDTTL
jgi:hypothetical protein